MNKVLYCVLFTALILTGCNSSTLSFSEIEIVPDNVQDKIDSSYKLQMITESEDTSYIIFRSKGAVTPEVTTKDGTLTINFNEEKHDDNEVGDYFYKLTRGLEFDTIDVLVNGQSTAFDDITIQ